MCMVYVYMCGVCDMYVCVWCGMCVGVSGCAWGGYMCVCMYVCDVFVCVCV